jgi:hypothetical protein
MRTFKARIVHQTIEMTASLSRPDETVIAAEGEPPKTALREMLKGQPRDGFVVRSDERRIRQERARTQINDWNAHIAQDSRDHLILDSRDNPISIPLREPLWRSLASSMLCEVDVPRSIASDEADDSTQQAPRVGIRGFHQQRHFRWLRAKTNAFRIAPRSNTGARGFSLFTGRHVHAWGWRSLLAVAPAESRIPRRRAFPSFCRVSREGVLIATSLAFGQSKYSACPLMAAHMKCGLTHELLPPSWTELRSARRLLVNAVKCSREVWPWQAANPSRLLTRDDGAAYYVLEFRNSNLAVVRRWN